MGSKYQGDSFTMSKSRQQGRAHFDMDNLIGSPFFLASLSVAVLGWIIAFISSIAANANDKNFSHFAWWAVIYELFVILGVATQITFGAIDNYKIATCAFLASALSFTTSTCNALIYSSQNAQQAAAAGHIFLSIVNIVWIFYFGSTSEAAPVAWMDSHSLNRNHAASTPLRKPVSPIYPSSNKYGSPYPITNVDNAIANGNLAAMASPLSTTSANKETLPLNTLSPAIVNYSYRAKAIYSYEANAEDPNEISFNKGDILEVADISGKWFQAKNTKGEFGIAPSNYLTLIPME